MMYQAYKNVRVFCEAVRKSGVIHIGCPEFVDLPFHKGRVCVDTLIPRLEGAGWSIVREQVGNTKDAYISALCPRHYIQEESDGEMSSRARDHPGEGSPLGEREQRDD